MDALRARVKELGFLTDQSFSPSVVTLSQRAFVELIVRMIPDKSHKDAKKALKDAGAKCLPDMTLNDVLCGIIGQVGAHVAGKPGKVISTNFYSGLSDFVAENFEGATAWFKECFENDQS
jgi:hypothetical protein